MKKIVLTGGPGAGKTAILEIAKKNFCKHVVVLPESASILFSGGFPRIESEVAQKARQRAIYCVQSEMEQIYADEGTTKLLLCDRGTLDGLAYWPGNENDFFSEMSTTLEQELAKYDAVVHVRTPNGHGGYNQASNPVRTENEWQASSIDQRLLKIWERHPKRAVIEAEDDFLKKVELAISAIMNFEPDCTCT